MHEIIVLMRSCRAAADHQGISSTAACHIADSYGHRIGRPLGPICNRIDGPDTDVCEAILKPPLSWCRLLALAFLDTLLAGVASHTTM